ncbi:MAG: hypothetical protein ACREOE_17240, partial [Gemmatimonadales bacterium]
MKRLLLFALALLLPAGLVTSVEASASASTPFSFSTTPALSPAFYSGLYWYAVRCASSPSTTISTSGSGYVKIGNHEYRSGSTVSVPLTAGQAVTVHQVRRGAPTYTVRCLPSDFPTYTAAVYGNGQAPGALVTPSGPGNYVIDFDKFGVPVWWAPGGGGGDAKFLSPTQIAWWTPSTQAGSCPATTGFGHGQYTIHNLDDSTVVTIGQDGLGGEALDTHDFQVLPNGDYLGIEYKCGYTADLSSWGGSTTNPIVDCFIVELDPQGNMVWSWD